MNGYCRVVVAGNVTRDPEIRYTPKGTAVCSVSLAVNRKWKDSDGNAQEEVTFVDCQAWGKTAETLSQYMRKGKPLLLEGRLKQESWEDKQTGQRRSKMIVVVESFTFLPDGSGQAGGGQSRQAPQRQARPAAKGEEPQDAPPDDGAQAPPPDDDGVPF